MKNCKLNIMSLALLISAVMAFVGCSETPPAPFSNEPEGFRDIAWGKPINAFRDLVIQKMELPESETKIVLPFVIGNLKNENLFFEVTKVDSINYIFTTDVLSSVTVMVHNEQAFQKLKGFCFARYGSRTMSTHDNQWKRQFGYPKYEKYSWVGKKTVIALNYNPDYKGSYYGQLSFTSREYDASANSSVVGAETKGH
jgi:hypothetical protein